MKQTQHNKRVLGKHFYIQQCPSPNLLRNTHQKCCALGCLIISRLRSRKRLGRTQYQSRLRNTGHSRYSFHEAKQPSSHKKPRIFQWQWISSISQWPKPGSWARNPETMFFFFKLMHKKKAGVQFSSTEAQKNEILFNIYKSMEKKIIIVVSVLVPIGKQGANF